MRVLPAAQKVLIKRSTLRAYSLRADDAQAATNVGQTTSIEDAVSKYLMDMSSCKGNVASSFQEG